MKEQKNIHTLGNPTIGIMLRYTLNEGEKTCAYTTNLHSLEKPIL